MRHSLLCWPFRSHWPQSSVFPYFHIAPPLRLPWWCPSWMCFPWFSCCCCCSLWVHHSWTVRHLWFPMGGYLQHCCLLSITFVVFESPAPQIFKTHIYLHPKFIPPRKWSLNPGSQIQAPGSRFLDHGSRILDLGSWIQDPRSRFLDQGSCRRALPSFQ